MPESRSAYIVIIVVTLLGVMAASIGISALMSNIILPIALVGIPIWLLVRRVKSGRVVVECQGCGTRMRYRRFRQGGGNCPICLSGLNPVDIGERQYLGVIGSHGSSHVVSRRRSRRR